MAVSSDVVENDAVELEAMRKEDCSWLPCQVSLCPTGVTLVVHYGNNYVEDILVSEEEALSRLRARSHPLRGDDCSHIEQGERVLATQKSESKSPFFDAEIEKALRVRHSKRVHCRCTFMIKWLHEDLKGGTLVVPSSSIMKLANESINAHPTVSAFLNAMRALSFCSTPPLPTVASDMDLDLHELLEKQIEEISSSVDASKKKAKGEMFGSEVYIKGQVHRAVMTSNMNELNVQVPLDQNHLSRSTRSRKTLQTENKIEDPPPPRQATQAEVLVNRSPLNPLAARAALASLMSKLPPNLESSFSHEGSKCFTTTDVIGHKQVTMESMSVTEYYCSSVVNDFSSVNKLSKVEAASLASKPDNIVQSLFSTRDASAKPQALDMYSTVPKCEKGHKASEVTNSSAGFTCSSAEKKIVEPRIATRLTRAAIQKGTINPQHNIVSKICIEEKKLGSATHSRLTRSAVQKEEVKQITETIRVVEKNPPAEYQSANKDKKTVATATPLDAKIDSLSTLDRSSLVKTEQSNTNNDREMKACVTELKILTNMRRLTRSAIQQETEKTNVETIEGLESSELPENVRSDSGKVSAVDNNILEAKKPITLPRHAEINLTPREERNKRRKTSDADKIMEETQGNVVSDGESSQGLKKKSAISKKNEVRFSPRLRYLPRTRSQNKA